MLISDERLVRDLPEKSYIAEDDYTIIEDLDGTKIAPIKTLKKIILKNLIFKTVEEMKSSTDLKEGDHCITLGYHTAGDGGAALYQIVYEPVAVEDGANWLYLYNSDVNRAKFIPMGGCIVPEQYGAYGDGVHDDYNAITKCINSPYRVRFTQQNIYKITRSIRLNTKELIDLDGCTIKPVNCKAFEIPVTIDNENDTFEDIFIKNGTIDMDNSNTSAIMISRPCGITIKDLRIINAAANAIIISIVTLDSIVIENCHLHNKYVPGNENGVGIYICGPSDELSILPKATIRNITFHDCYTAISIATNIGGNSMTVNIEDCSNTNNQNSKMGTFIKNTGPTNSVVGRKHINIKNINAIKMDTILDNTGNDIITLCDIFGNDINSFIDSSALLSSITIEGNITMDDIAKDEYYVFRSIYGKLYVNTSSICYDCETDKIISDNCNCELYDMNNPLSHQFEIYEIWGDVDRSVVNPKDMRNGIFIKTSSTPVRMYGGMKNQIIAICAQNCAFTITSDDTIDLGDITSLEINSRNITHIVYFRKSDDGKWVRL